MSLECQTCGREFPDAVIDPENFLIAGHDDEVVAHTHDAADGLGTITDYYCGPRCAAAAFSTRADVADAASMREGTDLPLDLGDRCVRCEDGTIEAATLPIEGRITVTCSTCGDYPMPAPEPEREEVVGGDS